MVLVASTGPIPFLLAQHQTLLPSARITMFAPACYVLAVCASLCIAYLISSDQASSESEKLPEYKRLSEDIGQPRHYYEEIDRFNRWGAANQVIGVTALCCSFLGYILIALTLFGKLRMQSRPSPPGRRRETRIRSSCWLHHSPAIPIITPQSFSTVG